MHICFVLDEFWPTAGGIATFYRMLSRLMVEAGHQVTILLDEKVHHEAPIQPEEGYQLIRLTDRVEDLSQRLRGFFLNETDRVARGLALGAVAREWFMTEGKSAGIDVLEVADTNGYGLLLADENLPPLVLACHGSMALLDRHQPHFINNRPLQIACELTLTGLADTMIAHSPMNVAEWTEITERPVRLARPPWHPLDGAFQMQEGRTYDAHTPLTGLVVGRLERRKGAILTAEACRVCQDNNVPVNMNWIGRTTRSAPEFQDMAAYLEHDYSDVWNTAFHWHGQMERAKTIQRIHTADYLLVASTWETLNMTVFEAMACGTPVIVSAGAGAQGYCRHEVDSLCVPSEDPQAIAAAIERLTKDASLRERIGRAGVDTVSRELAPDRVVGDRIEAYQAAIERRGARKRLLNQFMPGQPILEQVKKAFEWSEMSAIDQMSYSQLLRKLVGKLKRALTRN